MRDEVFLAYSKRPNGQRGLDKEKEGESGICVFCWSTFEGLLWKPLEIIMGQFERKAKFQLY